MVMAGQQRELLGSCSHDRYLPTLGINTATKMAAGRNIAVAVRNGDSMGPHRYLNLSGIGVDILHDVRPFDRKGRVWRIGNDPEHGRDVWRFFRIGLGNDSDEIRGGVP